MKPNPDRSRDTIRRRNLTETIRVPSPESIPDGYLRIPTPNAAIFAKAQVLSARHRMPIFLETKSEQLADQIAYWVHEAIIAELHEWLQSRVFDEDQLLGDTDDEAG